MASAGTSFEQSDVGRMALDKAKELFAVCDNEQKGFIIKRDMQRLQNELPALTPDQLEEVFDSLDQDHNGFLTTEEFIRGFGAFLGLQFPDDDTETKEEGESTAVEPEQTEKFHDLIETIGATDVLSNQEAVEDIWNKLRTEDPELLGNFEKFITSMSTDIKQSKQEFSALETALQQRSASHETEVKHLYEEMETQIKNERQKILEQERAEAQRMKEHLERDIDNKDLMLQEISRKQSMMETRFSEMSKLKELTEQENEQLQKERAEFDRAKGRVERDLDTAQQARDDYRRQLDALKKDARRERQERAKTSLRVTEGIANEREALVRQLEELREMNYKLRDERESAKTKTKGGADERSFDEPMPPTGSPKSLRHVDLGSTIEESESVDDGDYVDVGPVTPAPPPPRTPASTGSSLMHELAAVDQFNPAVDSRAEPLGGNELLQQTTSPREMATTPDRIFKVVFVGDSGVGKTCFLHRFCHNRFKPTFAATIGVDFTVKTIAAGTRLVALQLWDTAGQERFRSITKQYFRKADGVVLVYDVTSEQSFLNLRNWVQSVRDGVDEHCVLCIVGNKVDLCDSDDTRPITHKDGQQLAEEFETLYFETSAQTGAGISECMRSLALCLQDYEDQHLEDALKLEDGVDTKKSKCCGRGSK